LPFPICDHIWVQVIFFCELSHRKFFFESFDCYFGFEFIFGGVLKLRLFLVIC